MEKLQYCADFLTETIKHHHLLLLINLKLSLDITLYGGEVIHPLFQPKPNALQLIAHPTALLTNAKELGIKLFQVRPRGDNGTLILQDDFL